MKGSILIIGARDIGRALRRMSSRAQEILDRVERLIAERVLPPPNLPPDDLASEDDSLLDRLEPVNLHPTPAVPAKARGPPVVLQSREWGAKPSEPGAVDARGARFFLPSFNG